MDGVEIFCAVLLGATCITFMVLLVLDCVKAWHRQQPEDPEDEEE